MVGLAMPDATTETQLRLPVDSTLPRDTMCQVQCDTERIQDCMGVPLPIILTIP